MPRPSRRLLTYGGITVVAVAALAFAVPYVYANYIADDAPAPLALDSTTSAPDPSATTSGPDQSDAAFVPDGTWTVADDSEAGYRVDEVLNGQDVTVVGRTSDVTGQFVVTDGSAAEGGVEVDMTTVTTDSDARDSQFQGMIMNTEQFPTSTFTVIEPIALDALATATEPIEMTVSGELTILDATRTVDAQLTAQRAGDQVQVAGAIPITFDDFGVQAPDLGFVKVESAGTVEFLLTLTRT